MSKLNLKAVPNLKPNPLFVGLKESLKDPKCFKKIEEKLVIKSDHTHKSVKDFVACESCNGQRLARQKNLKKLGFTSFNQYLTWKKIMQILINKKDFQL